MHSIVELIYQRVCGTCDDTIQIIDQMIEDGDIDQEYFSKHEMEILGMLDDLMFACEVCGWNYEMNEMSYSRDMTCVSCADDMTKCPECRQNTLLSSMRADYCTNCGYEERYEDAYADVDPGGDFEDAEEFR